MGALITTVVGIILSLLSPLTGMALLGWISGGIAIAAAFWQYRDTLPFELNFNEGDWRSSGAELQLLIPLRRHGKKSPTATVLVENEHGYQEVMCDLGTVDGHSISINACMPFKGKVIVK